VGKVTRGTSSGGELASWHVGERRYKMKEKQLRGRRVASLN